MKHIICFHLFNDYSGSPKVLKTVLEGLLRKGYRVDLVTSKGGVLDELMGYENLHMHHYSYHLPLYDGASVHIPAGIEMDVPKGRGVLYQHIAARRACPGRKTDGETGGVSLP